MQPPDALRPARRFPLDAAVLAVLFLGLAALGWRRWPDLLVDFGQQLYIPWRLSEGDRLYRDILFLHGPLSQHLNGLLFRLFGASLSVLLFANLAILAGLTLALRRAIRLASDRTTAFLCAVLFLALFGMAQFVMVGNYNFVCPYTHEATHGTALAVVMLLFCDRWLATGRRRDAFLAGLALGMALETKIDVALAAAAAAIVALLLGPLRGVPGGHRRGSAAFLLAGAALPCATFLIAFLTYLPAGEAVRAAAAGFVSLPGEAARNPFYRGALGLDEPRANLLLMLSMSAWLLAFVAVAAGADAILGRLARHPDRWSAGLGLALLLVLVRWPDLVPWIELPRVLPVAAIVLTTIFLFLAFRGRSRPTSRPDPAGDRMLLLSVLGLGLLPKIALNVHLFHYGFYLAMPAALVLAAACLFWAPLALRARGCPGSVFRSLSVAVALAAIVFHLRWSRTMYGLKDLPVGRGGDTLLTYGPSVEDRGEVTAEALRWIEERTPAGATLVGLPEGIMLNYQARRRTTTPFVNFTMGEVIRFGEDRLLSSLRQNPPDYVALIQKKTGEFGVSRFGTDERYGRHVVDWIASRYDPVAQFGGDPLVDDRFGIRILERRREAE